MAKSSKAPKMKKAKKKDNNMMSRDEMMKDSSHDNMKSGKKMPKRKK